MQDRGKLSLLNWTEGVINSAGTDRNSCKRWRRQEDAVQQMLMRVMQARKLPDTDC